MSDERRIVEKTNLSHLEEITKRAADYEIDLILIGGNAVRAYTQEVSWRFTKDLDYITESKDLGPLYGMLSELGYIVEKTEFGLRGSKKITDEYSIELHISVDRVIDWSTDEIYELPEDIFDRSEDVSVKASFEENKGLEVTARIAPVEDILIMKMMTQRTRDQFDSVAIILDSFDRINLDRFKNICIMNSLKRTIEDRIHTLLVDIRSKTLERLWKENTGLELLAVRKIELRRRLKEIDEKL